VVGVRTAQDRPADARLKEPRADALQRRLARAAAEVESDDGELLLAVGEDEGVGVKGIQNAFGERVAAVAVAPHGDGFAGGDLAAGRACQEGLSGGGEAKQNQKILLRQGFTHGTPEYRRLRRRDRG